MVLTPHAVAGAAITSFFKLSPVTAFFAGFLSHFFLDALPHWDYQLRSSRKDKVHPLNNDFVLNGDSWVDFSKLGMDACLGLALAIFFFTFGLNVSFWAIVAGALGAVAPDALSFVYMKWRKEPMISLQKTHLLFHAVYRIYNPVLGVFLSCLVVIIFLFIGGWSTFSW